VDHFIFYFEFLKVVNFINILLQISTVKVKKAVLELVAG